MREVARDAGKGRAGLLRLALWGGAGLLLLAPLIAMQFTDEVAWTTFDFAFAAGMLGGIGLGLELAVRRTGSAAYRIGAAVALAAAFFLVWITGAVGIIGSERDDANLLYGGVLLAALVGALAARFRPAGLAWAMAAAALAQVMVPVMAWSIWPGSRASLLAPEVLGSTVVFAALWLVSAWLFRKAASREAFLRD